MSNSAGSPKRSNRCPAQTKLGKSCRAAPTEGGLCYFHAYPKKASELGRKGGSSRKRQPPSEASVTPLPALNNVTDVGELTDRLIEEAYRGQLDPQSARSMVNLLGLKVRLLELNPQGDARVPLPRSGNIKEIYQAEWLRKQYREWDEELKVKHADKFPKPGD